jgi:WXG100 family type VII secretion target
MAGQIRVNTAQVSQIASSIESLNKRLDAELRDSQASIQGLSGTWEGEASNATISAFNAFAAKYFETYYDVINAYVKFLRTNVDSGYFQTETTVTKIADAFKG